MPKWLYWVLLSTVVLFTVYFRFIGMNWDQGQHLHPDERFLTMVTTDLKWPTTFVEFLNTNISPLNPHNKNYSFYVYGTFPVFVTKLIAGSLNLDNYGDLILVGRYLSAFLELGICLIVFLIAYRLTSNKLAALLALFLYSCLPTPIQLGHFYATDTWVTFFTILSFYLAILVREKGRRSGLPLQIGYIFLGITLGLLAASKISGLLFLPIIVIGLIFPHNRKTCLPARQVDISINRLIAYSLITLFALLTLRLAQPYLFTGPGFFDISLNPKILANWKELANMSKPQNTPPYGYQWIPTLPIIYPALNLLFWGLGIPFSILTLLSLVALLSKRLTLKPSNRLYLILTVLWCLGLFVYQGTQFAKPLRYLYPMMPFLAILVGIAVGYSLKLVRLRYILHTTYCILGTLLLWNAFGFLSIYSRPHTRVSASEWIYQNIPAGSTITTEVWDDGLPLTLSANLNSSLYTSIALPLYDPDTSEKWAKLSMDLAKADYVLLTSNRLWRTIASLPKEYPVSAPFYDNLLHDRLGFETVAVFTSYPCLVPNLLQHTAYNIQHTNVVPPVISLEQASYCSLAMNTDGADETFTVYAHPKVIILKNVSHPSAQELYNTIYKN
jgi:4-amino-4-deoxy-L-arabinose transferase-like glycosyltransferase